jgi:PAS domain S-box-containing protein/diguanylate cyclase (GGDEF)-like protein
MGLHSTTPGPAKRRFAPLFTAVSPFRYGLAAVIVVTIAYATLALFPMIRRDLQLLRDVHNRDEQGVALAGELRAQLAKDRLNSIQTLLASGDRAVPEQAIRATQALDAQIAQTEHTLQQLGTAPADSQRQFHQSWLEYVAIRDTELANRAQQRHPAALGQTLDASDPAFARAELATTHWGQAFAAGSQQHLAEVSRTLQSALSDWFAMTLVKVAVLVLLILTDWKRARAEKQLQLATQELRVTQDRLHMAYDSAAVGMGIIGLDGIILSINAVAGKTLGYEPEEMIGKRVRDFIAPEFQAAHVQQLEELVKAEHSHYISERRYIRKDGASVWIRNNVNCMRLKTGERQCFFTSEEITRQKLANDRLEFLANYDPVTNLPNRHAFEERLAEALQPVSGPAQCIALLYLEIDSFDFLKGTFGRNAADEVLSELASSLTEYQQAGEFVGRLDDHVFGIIMPAAPYDQATMDRASQLREIFHRFSDSGKHRIPLSASIGIAYSDTDSQKGSSKSRRAALGSDSLQLNPATGTRFGAASSEALLKFARAAMLEARSRGGDAIFVADPMLQERAAQRHQIESALLLGLRQDEFRVVFQPQFQVSSGNLVRFEALCRWNSSELGNVPPDRFIPIAEQTGLISEIGRRVMSDALHQARMWTESGRRIGVAVNISPMQFMRPDFTEVITEVLTSSGFPPELLELEITEGIFIRDLNLAVARIRELQRLGLSVALDDFGTGYSSLSYLQRMPIDAVKLDRSFVSDLTTDAATVSMVRSVLSMAEALNLRVVSEGVETEAQLQILRSLGCDEAQGYLLGRPESAELALRRVLDSPLQPICTLA